MEVPPPVVVRILDTHRRSTKDFWENQPCEESLSTTIVHLCPDKQQGFIFSAQNIKKVPPDFPYLWVAVHIRALKKSTCSTKRVDPKIWYTYLWKKKKECCFACQGRICMNLLTWMYKCSFKENGCLIYRVLTDEINDFRLILVSLFMNDWVLKRKFNLLFV